MKKYLIYCGMLTMVALSGCQAGGETDNEALSPNNPNAINVADHDHNDLYNKEKDNDTDYGYVRYQKSPVANDTEKAQNIATLDREEAADSISKLSSTIPNVNDVATLVTDEDVLIAYKTDTKDRNATADQVKRTAMSIMPRYYHVYVSDNPQHIQDIERFSEANTKDESVEESIHLTIKEMLKSPQGRKMNDGENANGEEKNELNEHVTDEKMK
ncbi:YhcN/YlaJ family sporulation lipoprotein [Priestia flexa]|uniref:YhcN/YlaJ family sporulation lipoprotein n=1 Tax=Priestia flexa TaxID=86664 RepID=UPI002E22ABA9|nr:YhcN/YlaJ family sporulation lipoprotein [Priestia flexa]